MAVASRLDSVGNFTVANTGILDEVTSSDPNQYSVYFGGSGNYLSTPSSTSFDFGTNDFTIEAWIYPIDAGRTADASKFGGIITQCVSGSITNSWYFGIGISDSVFSSITFNSSDVTRVNATGLSYALNTWHHVACVRYSGTMTIYINGVSVGTASYSSAISYNASASVHIGRSAFGGAYENWLKGYISNLRVVKGTAVYKSNFIPSKSPLTAIPSTVLLTCQSSTIIDNSSNAFTITNNGSTLTYLPPQSDFYAATFSSQYISIPNAAGVAGYASDFTVELWFNATTLTGGPFGLAGQYKLANARSWILYLGADGSVASSGNGGAGASAAGLVSINTWHHLAWVKIGSTAYLYLDGNLVASTAATTPAATATEIILIGGNNDAASPTWRFPGKISNFRIVKGTALYTSTFKPDINFAPVSGTSVLALQNSSLVDNSTNRYAITNSTSVTSSLIRSTNFLTAASQQSFDGNHKVGGIYDEVTIAPSNQYASVFDGTTKYLNTPTSAALSFGTSDFTIELWAYKNTSSTNDLIITNRSLVSGALPGRWYLDTFTSKIRMVFQNTSSVDYEVTNTGSVDFPVGEWFHLAAVKNGSTITGYLNGISFGSISVSGSFGTSASGVYIGSFTNDSTWAWNGYVSNVRIVNGTPLYTSNFIPSKAPLTAIPGTVLLTCQNSPAVDNSPNAFTITNTGTVGTYNPPYPSFYAASFNGSSQYLNTPSNAAFTFGTGDFTIECWVNGTSYASNRIIVDLRSATLTVAPWILISPTDIRYNVAGTQYISGTINGATLNTNQWYHVAAVRSSGSTKLYVNGVQVGSTYTDTNNYVGTVAWIGGYNNGAAGGFFSGYISNFRIVKGVALYTGNFTPPTQKLTAISGTSLLTLQSSTIIDNSTGNGGSPFTITNTGSVSVIPAAPFTSVRQQYSDGDYLVSGIFDEVTSINESYSASFGATNQYLSIADNDAFELGSGDFTIETWMYLQTYSPGYGSGGIYFVGSMVSKDSNPNDNRRAFSFQVNGTASSWTDVYIVLFSSDSTYIATQGTYNFNLNTWYHVAAVRKNGIATLYVNGVSVGSGTNATAVQASAGPVTIGYTGYVASNNLAYWFPGYLSNVRIVKGIAVYTQNFTPPVSQLTAIPATSLLTCQSSTLVDNSTNAFTITNNGSVTTYKPPYSPFYAAAFDGTFKYLNTPSNVAFNFGTGDFTIELWAYKNTSSADDLIITNRSSVATTFAGDWWIDTNGGQIRIQFKNTSNTQYFVSNVRVLDFPVGQWFHLAVVKSGTTITGYLNGISFGNVTVTGSFGTTGSVYIGAFTNNNGSSNVWNWNGYISNVRIVKGVAVYVSDFTPSILQLTNISGTSLLTCQSSTIIDNSSNGFTITNTGTVTSVPREPF
jgi:uncharacterized membrane protein